jgi:molybdate transport system ATP-binding protein
MTGFSIDINLRLGDFRLAATFATEARVVGLFGRSGSGKTSILRCIAGLLRPDSGRIALNGRVVFDSAARIDLPARHRRVGLVFQDGLLFPHMSVRQNLLYGAWARGVSPPAGFDRTLELLDLARLLDRAPRRLSGGERQRVAIGRALLSDPLVLLMDEPVTAIDQEKRAEILPYLETLTRESTIPMLYVSHAMAEIERLAGQIVHVDAGRITKTATVRADSLPFPPACGDAGGRE